MKHFKIKTITILFCCLLGRVVLFGQSFDYSIIEGSTKSITVALSNGGYNPHSFVWTVIDCGGAALSNQNQNVISVTVPATSAGCCTLTLHYDGYFDVTTGTVTTTQPLVGNIKIKVLPVLISTQTTAYPCQTVNVNTFSGNLPNAWGNCVLQSQHNCPSPNNSFSWNGNCNSCSGNANNITFTVPCSPSSLSSPITVGATYGCNGSYALNTVSINIILQNPSISGAQTIGCDAGSASLTGNIVIYTASQVTGAAYYNWTFPSFMSTVSPSVHDQTIALSVNGEGSGNVCVTAYNQQSGSVHSSQVCYPVHVCCVPVVNTGITINNSNANYQSQAAALINSTNSITATGSATMHAGSEIHLFPGFEAHYGSEVHLYNAACDVGYYRLANFENNEDSVSTEETTYQYETVGMSVNTGIADTKTARDKFSIAPNPTNGEVTVTVFDKSSTLLFITVYNTMGSKMYELKTPDSGTNYVFSLADLTNGVYTVKLTFADYTANKLLIKQNE